MSKTVLVTILLLIVLAALLVVFDELIAPTIELPQKEEKEQQQEAPQNPLTLRLNETGSAYLVSITPQEVIEDSRCPVDVVCAWAGTVKVRALLKSGLGEAEQVFELNKPITTEAEEVTLIKVEPDRYSTKTITSGEYRFTFAIQKR